MIEFSFKNKFDFFQFIICHVILNEYLDKFYLPDLFNNHVTWLNNIMSYKKKYMLDLMNYHFIG